MKLRPGESSTIMEKDIHAPCGEPGSGLEFWSLTVGPFEDLAPSKTQTFDDCVIAREPALAPQRVWKNRMCVSRIRKDDQSAVEACDRSCPGGKRRAVHAAPRRSVEGAPFEPSSISTTAIRPQTQDRSFDSSLRKTRPKKLWLENQR